MSDFNPIPMYISTPPAKYKPSAARLAKLEPDIAAQLAVPPARGKCRGIKNDGDVCGRHAVPGMLTCSRHLAQEATVKAAEEAIEEESTEEEIAEESDDAWQEEVPEVAAEDEEDDEEDDEEYSPMYLSDGGEHQAEVEEVEDEDFYSGEPVLSCLLSLSYTCNSPYLHPLLTSAVVLRKPSTKFTGRTATSKSNKNSKGETAVEEFGAGLRIGSLSQSHLSSLELLPRPQSLFAPGAHTSRSLTQHQRQEIQRQRKVSQAWIWLWVPQGYVPFLLSSLRFSLEVHVMTNACVAASSGISDSSWCWPLAHESSSATRQHVARHSPRYTVTEANPRAPQAQLRLHYTRR